MEIYALLLERRQEGNVLITFSPKEFSANMEWRVQVFFLYNLHAIKGKGKWRDQTLSTEQKASLPHGEQIWYRGWALRGKVWTGNKVWSRVDIALRHKPGPIDTIKQQYL